MNKHFWPISNETWLRLNQKLMCVYASVQPCTSKARGCPPLVEKQTGVFTIIIFSLAHKVIHIMASGWCCWHAHKLNLNGEDNQNSPCWRGKKRYFDWISESFLTSWPCKCNLVPPCVYASASQGRDHFLHIAGLTSNMFCFSWAKRITDTQKPARQSGIISGALCWWNQITCSYSQRGKS